MSPKADGEKWGVGRPTFLCQSMENLVESCAVGGARRLTRDRFRHKLTEEMGREKRECG